MKTTNDMKQLLSNMAEHPEAYDDHQLEAAMNELDREPDVEAEWRRFSAAHRRRRLVGWQIAAAIAGGLIVAGGAAVAIHHHEQTDMLGESTPTAVQLQHHAALVDTLPTKPDTEYASVEDMPVYPGGTEQLMQFIEAHLLCPDTLLQAGIGGRVIVSFVVEKDGSPSNFKAMKTRLKEPSGQQVTDSTIIAQCEQEALRVLRLMPTWQPGKQMGQPVRVKYSVPIKFNGRKPENQSR